MNNIVWMKTDLPSSPRGTVATEPGGTRKMVSDGEGWWAFLPRVSAGYGHLTVVGVRHTPRSLKLIVELDDGRQYDILPVSLWSAESAKFAAQCFITEPITERYLWSSPSMIQTSSQLSDELVYPI